MRLALSILNPFRYGNEPGEDSAGKGGTGSGDDPGKPSATPPVSFTPEQLAELQRQINLTAGKVRDEERAKFDRLKAKETEEAKKLEDAKKGEFEKLYKTEAEARAALEAEVERLRGYSDKTHGYIDAEIKNWPDALKKTDPGKDNLDARMKWVETHRELATELAASRKAPTSEHGAGSGAGGGSGAKTANPAKGYIDSTYKRPDQK